MSWLFSQALVEEYSHLGLSDGVLPAQLNVMPTLQQFSRNDKTMDLFRRSPFGLTCGALTVSHGQALLTSFLAAFRAKTSALPAKAEESTLSDQDSGRKCRELSAKFDRDSSSWKTHQCLFDEVLPESSVILPRWGMMHGGVLSELTTPVLPTSAKESGFWPTPTTQDRTTDLSQGGRSLGAEARRWPTPTASRGDYQNSHGKKALKLSGMVKQFPTPNARDWKDSGPTQGNRTSPNLGTVVGGQLNPTWVEWLMGWPIGWTDLRPLETGKFRQWLRSHGIS